jgi:hypothetical protein
MSKNHELVEEEVEVKTALKRSQFLGESGGAAARWAGH